MMALARMLNSNEDEIRCEMARVYHIFDIRSLPVRTVATLAMGIGRDIQSLILAGIYDKLSLLCWMQTTDAIKGDNRPASLMDALYGVSTSGSAGYDSAEEFERARAAIIGGGIDG